MPSKAREAVAALDSPTQNIASRIFAGLAGLAGEPDRLMIEATHLKAHRTAASLFKKGRSAPGPTTCEAGWGGKRRVYPAVSAVRKAA